MTKFLKNRYRCVTRILVWGGGSENFRIILILEVTSLGEIKSFFLLFGMHFESKGDIAICSTKFPKIFIQYSICPRSHGEGRNWKLYSYHLPTPLILTTYFLIRIGTVLLSVPTFLNLFFCL